MPNDACEFIPESERAYEGKHKDKCEHCVGHCADARGAAGPVGDLIGLDVAREIRDIAEERGCLSVLQIRHGGWEEEGRRGRKALYNYIK